ncbi:glycosyltransferase [Campylobacter pinnipediorum]|uniref:Glycosyl transferase family 1 domain-containing protein n=1 Tax=Campylobacter pinnipediorum subsp. pinnipediorum TaxID=1660067 RepID=A0AAX0LBE9_9BACT|nr:glycosyltransferase [Campylobacter pinnipediorum]AQW81743.1 glycosyltransferase, family 1 [Campylobacter pinnipediorum subsp. pinnipediorum]AQW83419.1 glycosyltransferase, family 1 [Campylobacter pinnipediorum subsp. pinnipediorum]OPA79792.1 hypothetical protein BFG05_01430 [Campylobacter pinnipediorum subsp. pinnipediorum]OPA81603.1 hypothetical protein BFG04_00210 [Campylobacter pinnipediorum subsp. pinnipediorum]
MKVALFFRSNSYGGSVRVARFIYDILLSEGFNVILYATSSKLCNNGYFNNIPHKHIKIPRFNRDWFYIQRIKYFKKLVLETNAELIITTVNLNQPMLSIVAGYMNIKIIISEHGNHTGVTSLKKKILRYLAYKKASMVTFLTNFDMDYFNKLQNKRLVRNPMCIESFNKNIKKENIILFPNRIDKNKRLIFLLKAFSYIDRNIRDKYSIIVCGDGDEKLKQESVLYAKENNINLQILGFVSNISEYYAKSKIVALTSLSEGLPNILIESIFFNCARISVDCISGPNELIKDGYDGFLSELNDIVGFSKKLSMLMQDDSVIDKFCNNALDRKGEFAPENIQKIWIEIINKVLN